MISLAQVRRLEAVSFRSFPATTTYYDGTWAIRLTAGHPAKRLNSVNPLDPSDHSRILERLELARHRFAGFGRPLVFRQSPLAPKELEQIFDQRGWLRFDESAVMVVDLQMLDLDGALDQLPVQDVGLWVDSFMALSNHQAEVKPGLVEVISSIQPKSGLFLRQENGVDVTAMRCVHDNDLAGVFDLATSAAHRRHGFARQLLLSAMKWAKQSGASHAWLQVELDNIAAIRLYENLGFYELYRYSYRKPAGQI